jgi:serralysin
MGLDFDTASAGPSSPEDEPTDPTLPATAIGAGDGPPSLPVKTVAKTNNQNIDGVLQGTAWNGASITYSFPTSSASYGTAYGSMPGQYPDNAPFNGFASLTTAQQADVKRAFALVSGATNVSFSLITESSTSRGTIRLANSSQPATAYAFFPGTAVNSGDIFFGTTGRSPVMGNFDSAQAILHEIGHALGLKHGFDTSGFGAMAADRQDVEFSVMNYASYIGGPTSASTAGPGSSPQTFMMYDIAALQQMYGANFGRAGTDAVYTWSPDTGEEFINGTGQGVPVNNHIFATVWTGGANSTYNLKNFNQNSSLDMRPGYGMKFSNSQLADLGFNNLGAGKQLARYNIYNALIYNNDTRSEIGTLITGNGNDTVTGNDIYNTIILGNGNDTVNAGNGGATIDAGDGRDTLNGSTLGEDTFVLRGGTYTVNGNGADNATGGSIDTLDLTNLTVSPSFVIDEAAGTVTDAGVVRVTFTGIEQIIDPNVAGTIDDLGFGVTIRTGAGGATIDGTGPQAGHDVIVGGAGDDTIKPGNAQGADTVSGGGGRNTLDLSGLSGGGTLLVDLSRGVANFDNTTALNFSGFQMIYAGGTPETFLGQSAGDPLTIHLGSAADTYIGGSVGNTIYAGSGSYLIEAGSGGDVIYESAADMLPGTLNEIARFHPNDGINGTSLVLPASTAVNTAFTADNGGTRISTAVGGGIWSAFIAGADPATVQSQTHFLA